MYLEHLNVLLLSYICMKSLKIPKGQSEATTIPKGQSEATTIPKGQSEDTTIPKGQSEITTIPKGQSETTTIPKSQSETTTGMTYNTMIGIKRQIRQTMIYKTPDKK
jgi:hypothetical protein